MQGRRISLSVGMVSLVMLAVAPTASANQPECFGKKATIVGTNGPDFIVGSTGDDVIVGKGGDDLLFGQGGDDRICGNDGDDSVIGGSDDDKLSVGAGKNSQLADGDRCFLACDGQGGGDNVLSALVDGDGGGDGNDLLLGSDRTGDLLFGEGGDDEIHARGKVDFVTGGLGDDHIYLGSGKPTVQVAFGDNVFGSAGPGEGGDDVIFGGYRSQDEIFGEDGNDELHGSGKGDYLEGDPGNDLIFGGPKDDFLQADDGERDVVNGKDGQDQCAVDPEDKVRNCENVPNQNRPEFQGQDASDVRHDAIQRVKDRLDNLKDRVKKAANDLKQLDTKSGKHHSKPSKHQTKQNKRQK